MTDRIEPRAPVLAVMTPDERVAYVRAQGAAARVLADAGNNKISAASCPYAPGAFAAAWLAGFGA